MPGMTTQELSDVVLSMIQEEMSESVNLPWAEPRDDGLLHSRFSDQRIGDVLLVTLLETGQRFTVTVAEVPAGSPIATL